MNQPISHFRRTLPILCLLALWLTVSVNASAATWYVTPTGADTNVGKSWAAAKATVQGAMMKAVSGDQIWVQAGTYANTAVTMNSGVLLYGGFKGTESRLSQRDYIHNVTVLDGGGNTVVSINANTSLSTLLDGFTLQNGASGISASGSMTIKNNTIQNSSSYGVLANGPCYIYNNFITNNMQQGIYVTGQSATILQNTILGNGQGGIYMVSGSRRYTIKYNYITQNSGPGVTDYCSSGGYYVDVISNNLISGNSATQNGQGGGIYINGSNPQRTSYVSIAVTNNTLVGNACSTPTGGGAIYYETSNTVNAGYPLTIAIANNLLVANSSGIADGSTVNETTPTLTTNDVYGSTYNNYDGIAPGATDISINPMFVDQEIGDYHLSTHSPCINAGTNSFVSAGDTDLSGNPRIYGARVDIGAYEWSPAKYADLASVAFSASTLVSGNSATGIVKLTSAAPPSGAVVQLYSPGNITLPSSVLIPAGGTSAFFAVTATAVDSPQPATIFATYRGITQSATLTINPLIYGLSLSSQAVTSATSVTAKISFYGPAPAGSTITLTSSDPSVTVPASLTVPTGATSISFTAKTTAVTSPKQVTITATNGVQTLTGTLIVDPSATLKAISIASPSLVGGYITIGVVTLKATAPTSGIAIPITCSMPGIVSVPTYVVVPGGQRSVSFPIVTTVVSASTPVTISANLGTATVQTTLNVLPNSIASLVLLPSTVQGTEDSFGIVTLALPATVDTTISLSGNATASPDFPTVVIPAGSLQGYFHISTVAVTQQTTVPIIATLAGTSATATLTVTP